MRFFLLFFLSLFFLHFELSILFRAQPWQVKLKDKITYQTKNKTKKVPMQNFYLSPWLIFQTIFFFLRISIFYLENSNSNNIFMKVTLETPKKKIQNYFHNFFDIESGNRYIQNPTIFFSYTFFFFFEVGGKWQHRNSFKIKKLKNNKKHRVRDHLEWSGTMYI